MPRPRTRFSLDEKRQVYVGWFHDLREPGQTWTPRFDLCSKYDCENKITKRGKIKRSSKEQADFLTKRWAERLQELLSKKDRTETEKSPKIQIVFQVWLDQISMDRSPETYRLYQRAANLYLKSVGNHPVDAFTKAMELKFLKAVYDAGRSQANAFKMISTIQTFFHWASQSGYCPDVKITKPRKTKKEPKIFTQDDVARTLARMRAEISQTTGNRKRMLRVNQMRAFFMVLNTGMRPGEVWSLALSDIDLRNGVLLIRDHLIHRRKVRVGVVEEFWQPKERIEKTIPINAELARFLADDLAQRLERERYYIDDGNGVLAYCSSAQLSRPIGDLQREIGIDGIKPLHGGRGTVISRLLQAGASPVQVKDLVGHQNLETTLGYLNTADMPKRALAETISTLIDTKDHR